MKKNFLPIGLIIFITAVVICLGKEHYAARPITSILKSMLTVFDNRQKNMQVSVKALSHRESEILLGHDLLNRGVQPLHITIHNNTPEEYSLCPSSVDLNSIDAKKVARKVLNTSIPRAIAFKIAGFFFWPFMIPGTIDSIRTMYSNNLLKKDLKAKSMKKEVIPGYSIFNRILYVPQKDLRETFDVTLIELKSLKPVVLSVSLSETDASCRLS